jgi:hypothetical protein
MKKKSLQQFHPLSEAENEGLVHPAQDNFGNFLELFQPL